MAMDKEALLTYMQQHYLCQIHFGSIYMLLQP